MISKLGNSIIIFLKGMLMGIADLVPGISGGTIAFITGIYEDFIEALNNINLKIFEGDLINQFTKKKFDFIIKSPPASHFIREADKLKSGSKEPGRNIVGYITKKQVSDIAKQKMSDLNANDIEEASKIIAGSARSMGIEVKE